MRLILLLASIVTVGAAGVSQGIIPLPTQMVAAIRALGDDPAQFGKGVDPVDAGTRALPQILRGSSADDQGLHGAAVTIPRGSFHSMNNGAVGVGQNGMASSLLSQVQQNNVRMQDTAAYARNPAALHGAPPH